jgi:hypothetical protein
VSSPNKSDKKAFFAGLHGAVTGIAALATASVAIIGLSINQGWIGGTKSGGGASVTTTAAGGPQYSVDPPSLAFQLLSPATVSVDVSNIGSVPMTVETPRVAGSGASHFHVADQTCGTAVERGASCQVQVTFDRAGGSFNAVLVIHVAGAGSSTEIPITATIL